MRFQKRIKILPGVTINLSRKGVSTSVGVTGARVAYGHGAERTTIGVPGTGISHTEVERSTPAKPQPRAQENETANLLIGIGFIAALMAGAWVISKLF